MKDPRMDALHRHAADLGLDVDWTLDLPAGRHGCYLHDRRVIRLHYRLTAAQALAALAHEVAHAIEGHRATTPAHERRADELGASLVITSREYAAAEASVGPHLGSLARELGVTPRLVEGWRRWFGRRHGAPAIEAD